MKRSSRRPQAEPLQEEPCPCIQLLGGLFLTLLGLGVLRLALAAGRWAP